METEGLARSVHTRLIQHAKDVGLDSTLVLARYGIERFLYRQKIDTRRLRQYTWRAYSSPRPLERPGST